MSPHSPQLIAMTDAELDALHGTGPLAFQTYILLRAWMDFSTGITGRRRAVSLGMLRTYCETHTPRGGGLQIEQPSEKAVRTALDRLIRVGLLRRLSGERLTFLLPLALVASARPEQTRHGGGTYLSTGNSNVKAAPAQEKLEDSGPVHAICQWPNWAHIRYQENLKPTGPAVDKSPPPPYGSAAATHTARKAGLDTNRLLQLGVQLGKPPRPGESWTDYRERLLAARPAHRTTNRG
ncbi:hypothetical protein [Zoogloea sp. LCSB751]|uniref:hypothetical protein n=1 Tax=Zoogloea sp. LCSB751 TaxID=1965277 RepID=UPI001116013C|nr:hypothetical protein [Zoogloea sp. LCSB751]